MYPVHVFGRGDGGEGGRGNQGRGKGRKEKDTMGGGIMVEYGELGIELGRGGIRGEGVRPDTDAAVSGALFCGPEVALGIGWFPNVDHGEARGREGDLRGEALGSVRGDKIFDVFT